MKMRQKKQRHRSKLLKTAKNGQISFKIKNKNNGGIKSRPSMSMVDASLPINSMHDGGSSKMVPM
jgi:hypothetical protein